MSDLVERLKRRADEMDALSSAVVPTETLTLAWRVEAKAALDKAARDNDSAAAEITRLQKELDTAREDALEQAAATAYRVCAETRHVTLGDKAAAAIRALKDKEVAG